MASYDSGELVWETTGASTPRWVLLLDGPPGSLRRRVAPEDPATPQAASPSQLGYLCPTPENVKSAESGIASQTRTPCTCKEAMSS